MKAFVESLAVVSLSALLVACGSSQAEPETPSTEATEESEPSGEEESEATSDATSDEEEPPEDEPEEAKPARDYSPKDVVTGEGVLFAFSFNDSEAYQAAEEQCAEKAKDDPQKKAACMTKFRDQFETDSIVFQKDDEGKWWWLTLRKRGKSLKALHKIEIEFGEETDDAIKLLPKGRDKGSKPMGRIPKEVMIGVPSRSQIVLTDPKHGKLVFTAKMGLLGELER